MRRSLIAQTMTEAARNRTSGAAACCVQCMARRVKRGTCLQKAIVEGLAVVSRWGASGSIRAANPGIATCRPAVSGLAGPRLWATLIAVGGHLDGLWFLE